MERFFWVKIEGEEDVTIATLEDGEYWLPGSGYPFRANEMVIGAEIHPSKTGLLSALNEVT